MCGGSEQHQCEQVSPRLDELVQLQVRERFSAGTTGKPRRGGAPAVGQNCSGFTVRCRNALTDMAAHAFRSMEEEERQPQIISV